MPERKTAAPGLRVIPMRTGTRCTTLTQLPLEFCAGRTENSELLAGLTLSTVPDQTCPGYVSTVMSTWLPGLT